MSNAPSSDDPSSEDLESTTSLFERIRAGDALARERLFARMLPALTRWAHRRLPASARDLHDTEDLVQSTLVRAFHHLDGFESRGQGAFLAYLRRILLNAIRDELRRTARRPVQESLDDTSGERHVAPEPSALEQAIGSEAIERYERALAELADHQQQAVLMRIELDLSYAEIADTLGLVSPEAARKTIGRGLLRMAEIMRDDD